MKTYNTYQEAKIANPDGVIYEFEGYFSLFKGIGSKECNPADYCMTVEKFLSNGHKFVGGDVVMSKCEEVVAVTSKMMASAMGTKSRSDCDNFVLQSAALETQMNIDNLATQTPEEKEALDLIDTTPHQYEMSKFSKPKEVEWSDSDELPPLGCEVMTSYTDNGCDDWCDFHGPSKIIAYHGDYVWVAHHGKFNRVHELSSIEFERVNEESTQQREERELEELADTACENMFGESIQNCRPDVAATVRCMIDLGYRKESN